MHARRRIGLLLLAVAIAPLALLLASPETAGAHAVLVRSSPESQVAVAAPPPVIDLWFSEPLEADFSSFELFASDGTPLELVGMRLDPDDPMHLSALTRGLGPGIFTVVYHTLSTRDGHEWSGSTTFTVLNTDGTVPTGASYAPDLSAGTTPAEATGRWMVFAAFSLFAGGTLISVLAASTEGGASHGGTRPRRRTAPLRRPARRLSVRLGIAALPLAAGGSLLQFMARQDALGGSAIDLLTGTRFGTILLWRSLALLALACALGLALLAAKRGRPQAEQLLGIVAAAATLGGLVTISLLSHAAAAPGSFWATLADAAHLLLAATWAGGLLVMAALLVQIRRSEGARTPEAGSLPVGALVGRFSLFATAALGILAATGLLRMVGEIPTADALFNTDYGDWLLIKLGLLLVPVAVALGNRSVLARWRRGAIDDATLRLRARNLFVLEATLAVLVLGTVAVLGQVPTPRGDASPAAATRTIYTDVNQIEVADDLTIHLQVSPAVVGSNELRVHLYHPDGSPIGEVERVQLELSAALSGGGDVLEPEPQGNDIYTAKATFSSLAAEWSVAVDVRRAGLDDARIEFRVPIQVGGAATEAPDRFGSPAPQLSRNFLWALLLLPIGATLLAIGVTRDGDRRDGPPRTRGRRGRSRETSRGTGRGLRFAGVRVPTPSFRTAGVASVLVAIVLGVSGSPHSHGGQLLENPFPADADSIARGAEIYAANCTSCHGTQGRGDGPLALTLTPPPADLALHVPLHPEGDTYIFIANGFPNTAMPAWSEELSEEEIWDVVNFLRSEFGQ